MIITNNNTLIDNDFLGKIYEIKFEEQKKMEIINQMFSNLKKIPVMHTLIYENELLEKYKKTELFEKEVVSVAKKEGITQNDTDLELYYKSTFEDLYFSFTGKSIYDNPQFKDIWKDWIRRKSLGEIHSITTCCICECDMFLSDDGDSKQLSELVRKTNGINIRVWTREELLKYINHEGLNKKARSALTHKR